MVRSIRRFALKLLFSVLVFLVFLEVLFRLVPALIPTNALLHFEPALRSSIAKGRFSTHDETILLDRDDGGPKLRVWKPFAEKAYGVRYPGSVPVVATDEVGFCNPPGTYDATPTLDLLAVGDSFTWCHAVRSEAAWPLRAGELSGLTAYNLGRGGHGPYEYVQILKHFGLRRSPRVVVLNIYGGNDLRDAALFHAHRDRPATPDSTNDAGTSLAGWQRNPLGRHSYVFNLICGGSAYMRQIDTTSARRTRPCCSTRGRPPGTKWWTPAACAPANWTCRSTTRRWRRSRGWDERTASYPSLPTLRRPTPRTGRTWSSRIPHWTTTWRGAANDSGPTWPRRPTRWVSSFST
jgi:hypothetical protein